jgi:hypothetical protein
VAYYKKNDECSGCRTARKLEEAAAAAAATAAREEAERKKQEEEAASYGRPSTTKQPRHLGYGGSSS